MNDREFIKRLRALITEADSKEHDKKCLLAMWRIIAHLRDDVPEFAGIIDVNKMGIPRKREIEAEIHEIIVRAFE